MAHDERPQTGHRPGIEDSLAHACSHALAEAKKLWPRVQVTPAGFVGHVQQHLPAPDEAVLALESERGPELVLAFACSQGDPHALAAFEQRYQHHIDAILAGVTKQQASRDEAKQSLRQHLLLKRGSEPPRIAKYGGRGSLLAFVRAVAIRVALDNLRARNQPPGSDEDMDGLPDGAPDPLAEYTAKLYASECKAAFADALQNLAPRTRTILRYHVVDQLSIDQIGRIYRVHRATAARWVNSAREEMVRTTRKVLMTHLQVDPHELESVLRLIGSDLDVSAERLLRATQAGA